MTTRRIAQNVETARDVALLRLDKRRTLVVGCDSIGAVGLKPLDALRVRPETVGKFAARVALMEVISVGAQPICISVALCVEPVPTGHAIMNGVRGELKSCGLKSISVVQSSEKNFSVKQTSVGTTVNGIADNRQLRIGRCKREDWLVTVGTPTVGRDVVKAERNGSIADLNDIFDLLDLECVHEVIPVGSRGIFQEARTIAIDSRLTFSPTQIAEVNVEKSAGPATVVICAIKPGKLSELSRTINKPLSIIGELC